MTSHLIVAAAAVLLLVRNVSPCVCTLTPSADLSINCSAQDLNHIPEFPSHTSELYLQHNHLSMVPQGFFDRYLQLRVVDLSGNPFHCDCNIQYLRVWLLKNPDVLPTQPTCSTPPAKAHRTIISLDDTEVSSCARKRCSGADTNLALGFLLCGILGCLVWSLRITKGLSFTLGIGEKHGSLRAESLSSLKPKHRARAKYRAQHGEDMETPLMDMDILPQIIDTLHRHHNIKIKEN